jgi:hypothetical protein
MTKKLNGVAVLAFIGLIAFGTLAASGQSLADTEANSIVGTWLSTVTFVDCTTGSVIRSFPTMNTFNQGGTMLETPRSLATRSPGHGVWERIKGNEYSSVFKFFRSNADGTDNGYQIVQRLHVLEDGTLTTTAVFQNYNAAGAPTTSGCALESATRLQ